MRAWIEKAFRWMWHWRWVLLMNVYLMSPIFLYEFHIGQGGPDKTIFFVLSASVGWLLVAQLIARRIWIAHALMFPLYVVVGVDLYVISQYDTRLSSSMLLTIFENLEDAREYTETHYKGMVSAVVLVLAAYGYALWRIRDLRVTTPRLAPLVPLAGLIVVYAAVHHILIWWLFVVTNDRNSPFGIFPQGYTTISLYEQSLAEARQAQNFAFGAKRREAPAEPELYVLVVGESSRSLNWRLYGYDRDTNPELSRVENLVVFRDAITQAAVTRMSVPLILTRGTIEDEQRTARERSVVSAFHEVGFRTYWASTQQRDPFTGAINRYPKEADVQRFFERRYDSVLVDTVKEMIAEHGAKEPKMFFVVHTLGSHFTLTSRYPRSFNVFPDDDSKLTEHERLINAYDNTVVYTDHVLSTLIDLIRQRAGIKALFYASDHGDNLRDDERNLFGHYHNNEYDLPIPMLFWYSDEFAQRHPEEVAAAKTNAALPVNTRVVFHTLIDLAGISVNDPETKRLSVVSRDFTPFARMVLGNPKPFDFDHWAAERGLKASGARAKSVGAASN